MITAKHLAVIRAALQFWDEEMSPHDPAICTGYFDEPIGNGEWIKDTVAFLRERMAACQLRYVLCSPEGTALVSDQLFETLDEAQAIFPNGSAEIAIVLIFEATG